MIFDDEAPGEHSVGVRAKTTLAFQKAMDESLIVHRTIQFYGGFPPNRDRDEDWMRCQLVTNGAGGTTP